MQSIAGLTIFEYAFATVGWYVVAKSIAMFIVKSFFCFTAIYRGTRMCTILVNHQIWTDVILWNVSISAPKYLAAVRSPRMFGFKSSVRTLNALYSGNTVSDDVIEKCPCKNKVSKIIETILIKLNIKLFKDCLQKNNKNKNSYNARNQDKLRDKSISITWNMKVIS